MKAIQLLINSQLPNDLKDYTREYDTKSVGSLMAEVARKYPDQYERISKFISDIGRKASYFQGESLTLSDNKAVIDKAKIMAEMDLEIEEASKNTPDKEEFEKQKLSIWEKYNDRIQKETTREALAKKNNLAYSVVSGARGKPPQLKMMLSTPGLYTDANDNVIPLFIRNSFAEGLRPAEYLAGTYGARKSVLCLHQDTHVRLPDGDSLPIKYINPGMYVLGADKDGNTFPVRVVRVYDQGLQPVKRYIFRRGCGGGRHEVVCTDKHAFLQNDYKTYNQAYNRFKKGKAPRPKAELIHSKAIYSIGEKRARQAAVLAGGMRYSGRKEPYALMLGILTGDGCLTDSDLRIRLSCADESMINDLAGYMYGLNLKIADRRTADNFDWEIVADNYTAADNKSIQKGVRGFVANARMSHKQILIDEGLAFCSAETKKLPTNIHTWDNESTASYIAGLIATDGSIYFDANTGYPRVSFAMTAKDVIFGLHKLLQHRFGVYGTEISFRDSGGFGSSSSLRKNRLWEFSVTTDTSIKRLLSVLPPIPGCKENKRQQALLSNIKQKNPYPKARLEFVKDEGFAHCYDIEVDHPDHLFVLDSGLITSNSTKRATAKGGDLAKQMVQSAANLVVSENDCGAANGISLGVDDKSLRGRVLARDIGKVPAGTVLDKHALSNIRNQGVEKLIVRSPMTCQSKEGVCARCMGLNALGKFPAKGESVGITAAQAIGEPITQGALNCLAVNTKVLMADYTEKYIQSIKPGEMVMGADVNGNIFPTKVTHVWDQGLQPVQRRFYKMGQTKSRIVLESTEAHPVLSNRKTYGRAAGKTNLIAEKLVAGYKHNNLAAVLPVNNNSHGIDERWAVFIGAYLGDGIRWDSDPEKSNSVTFSCADETEVKDLNQILKSLNVQLVKCKRSHDWRVSLLEDDIHTFTDTTTGQVLKGYRNPCKLKLIEYGLNNVYAHEKTIHPRVWQWSNQSVADLIAGFIATDGSVYKNSNGHIGIAFTSTSEILLLELQKLMRLKLCVYSSALTQVGKVDTDNRKHTQWQFTVTRLDQIKRLFSFIENKIPGVKNQLIKEYISNVIYIVRNPDIFYRALRDNEAEQDLGFVQCYDITVEHKDSLFVLANSLIVSNTKHQGGAAGVSNRFSGFSVINQFVQTPDTFPDKAVLSKKDGQVNSIIAAPQGGYYITVDNEPHYVAPGYPVTVKVGDKVEAGDSMSEGLADPGEVVELRGLGAGRKYYSDRLKQLLDDSGMEADRRNTELMARAALDHLQITDIKDDDNEYLPDDVVSYSYFSNRYTPPKDTVKVKTDKAVGNYLQSPALHYTIGTRITPKISKDLSESGFNEVFASPSSPTFKPHMVRLRAATHHGTDWLASMHTSYLKKQISDSAIRGEDSNIESNIHFAPRLAIGTNFGENIDNTGKF